MYVIGDRNVVAVPQIFHYENYEIFPNGQFHPVMLTGVHSRSRQPREAEGYFEGEKTLEKTVDELYSRISIKQSEEE